LHTSYPFIGIAFRRKNYFSKNSCARRSKLRAKNYTVELKRIYFLKQTLTVKFSDSASYSLSAQKVTLGRAYEQGYCETSFAGIPAIPVISQNESIFDQ
jgi:hypothetical protein